MIKLTPQQTNQLANPGYWMVMQQSELFSTVLANAAVPAAAETA